jgi:hypothetical protein
MKISQYSEYQSKDPDDRKELALDVATCSDPIVITESKTFLIQKISIRFGLMDSCHSRR